MVKYKEALAIVLCLVAQLIVSVPAAHAAGAPTVLWDEEHVVDGIESYSGEVIALSADLTVTGSLTLDGTELVVAGQIHGDCAIKVESGGKLTIISGSVIRSSDPDIHYTFAVYSGGRLTMNDSRITDCGWDDLENGGQNPEDVRGLYLASDNACITNSTLTQNGFGVIIDGACSPLVRNNNISANHGDGVRIMGGATPVIDRNKVVGNALTYPWFLSFQADLTTEGSSPRISNNTVGAVTVDGQVFPNEGIVLGEGGSPVVENNLVEGLDGEFSSYYGILITGDTTAKIQKNRLRGNLEALVAFGGRLTVADNTIERGTPVSQMNSFGIEDGSASYYANNSVKGYDTGILAVSPSTSFFENLTVTDCPVGVDAFSTPGSTFAVTVANSTFSRNGRDAQATNPHFGPGGTLSLVNPSYDRNKVSASGSSEKLMVAWYCRAQAAFESDGRPAAGALMNFTDATGALAAQTYAGPDGSSGPFALAEYILSGGVRAMKSPYIISAAKDRWTGSLGVQLDRNRNVSIGLDDIPPWMTIQSPANGTLTNAASIRISGGCEPKSTVSLNGIYVPVASDGSWATMLKLQEGQNRITATATDKGGNTAAAEIEVVSDTVRPNLMLTAPREGLLTNQSRVVVSGTAEPSARLKVNGASVNCSPDGSFRVELELFEGENTITVECRDVAGNVNSATRQVVLDTALPELAVTAPKNGTLTKEPSVTLTGRAEPESAVSVNGGPVNLNGGQFSFHAALAEGDNLFVFLARDRAGNTALVSVTVRLDTIAPEIVIVSPAKGSLINKTTVEVRGTTEAGATVKVQGVKVNLKGNEFCTNLTIPEQGLYTIKVEAQDAARNLAETTLTVTLDTVPPALKLTAPAAKTVTNQTSIKVTGKTEPGARVRLDGMMAVADAKGQFAFTAALRAEGKNVLEVEAEDAAGNSDEASIEVFRDTVLSYNISSPSPVFKTKDRSVLVRGVAEPGSTVSVAGRTLGLNADGSFAAEVTLETGPNEIKVTVRDRAGNQGETILVVTKEKPAQGKSTPGFEALVLSAVLGLAVAMRRRKQK